MLLDPRRRPEETSPSSPGPTSTPSPDQLLEHQPELRGNLNALLRCVQDAEGITTDASAISRFAPSMASQRSRFPTQFEFEDFEVGPELGRGAMGTVYLARQKSVGRDVALKILAPNLQNQDRARERFRREAMAAGGLKDDAIPAVYGASTESGTSYIAMEFVEGVTLARWLEKHPAPTGKSGSSANRRLSRDRSERERREWLIRSFVALTRALQRAHDAGIVHRDLKPSNLMVTPDDSIKILDFGLVHIEDSDSMTMTGDRVGTLLYMSPEQRSGLSSIDGRADQFSLAAILYESLMGDLPWEGSLDLAAVPGGQFDGLPKLASALGGGLHAILSRALRSRPNERYASIGAFGDDLVRYLNHEPILAKSPGLTERTWLRARRRPAAAAAVLLLVLSLFGGTAWWLILAPTATLQAVAEGSRDLHLVPLRGGAPVSISVSSGAVTEKSLRPGRYRVFDAEDRSRIFDPPEIEIGFLETQRVHIRSRAVRVQVLDSGTAPHPHTPLVSRGENSELEVSYLKVMTTGEGATEGKLAINTIRLSGTDSFEVIDRRESTVPVGHSAAPLLRVETKDGSVFLVHHDWGRELRVLEAESLEEVWDGAFLDAGNGGDDTIAIDLDGDGNQEFIARDVYGTLFAFSLESGESLWSLYPENVLWRSPSILEGGDQGPLLLVPLEGQIDAHQLTLTSDYPTPERVWSYPGQPGTHFTTPIRLPGSASVVAFDGESRLHQISSTGAPVAAPLDLGLPRRPTGVTAADLDGDGIQELIHAAADRVTVIDLRPSRSPRVRWQARLPAICGDGAGNEAWRPLTVDWDPRGARRDVVITTAECDLYVLDGTTGQVRLHRRETGIISRPAIAPFGKSGEEAIIATVGQQRGVLDPAEERLIAISLKPIPPGEIWGVHSPTRGFGSLIEHQGAPHLILVHNHQLELRRLSDGGFVSSTAGPGTRFDPFPLSGRSAEFYVEPPGEICSVDASGNIEVICRDLERETDPRVVYSISQTPDGGWLVGSRGFPPAGQSAIRILDAEGRTQAKWDGPPEEASGFAFSLSAEEDKQHTAAVFSVSPGRGAASTHFLADLDQAGSESWVQDLEGLIVYPDRQRAAEAPLVGMVERSEEGQLAWWTSVGGQLVRTVHPQSGSSRGDAAAELFGVLDSRQLIVLAIPSSSTESPREVAAITLPPALRWRPIGTFQSPDGRWIWTGIQDLEEESRIEVIDLESGSTIGRRVYRRIDQARLLPSRSTDGRRRILVADGYQISLHDPMGFPPPE